ncbi:hypothetical protein CU098_003366 [Rhizopus stolonifer]|uniref:Vacuolar protein sorting-associated protein 54 n=1 Tax=Rhizopus stolonifer TaxID=4846 RepID=A0A367KVH2_RHIST|nr:hypothetical protein CU098_003366 [Rhizopus stolonifer]
MSTAPPRSSLDKRIKQEDTVPLINYSRPLARERPFARDDSTSPNSRPPSIRSATSFGRPLGRFMTGNHARHHSNYSNFSTMSETALPWTTRDIGFNAISGVLNDPAKTKDVTKPNKADIPPVTHASIARIKPSDFESYLEHIQPAFERYQHNKLNTPSYPVTPEEELEEEDNKQVKRTSRNPYSLPQLLSSESLLDDDTKTPPRDLPMLENVPAIFFEPDFFLENPHVFDTVCEGADIVGNSGPNPPLSTNSILQEKLSYYLDTVEIHLLQEIENRSSSFFEALSNLQQLHQQTLDCVSQIHTIRQKMKQIQDTECQDGLSMIRLQVKKRNLEKLHQVTRTIKEIRSAQPTIQSLLGAGDYFAALDLIDQTKTTLQQHDLSEIKALANFSAQLDEMQKAVGVMMQHDFLSILLSDLSYRLENKTKVDQDELQDRLKPSTTGLVRTDMLLPTLQEYRERLMVDIKDIVRKNSAVEDPSKPLKTMSFTGFFDMLHTMFDTLIHTIDCIAVYHQLVVQITHQTEIEKESAEIVFSAADVTHVRIAKIIGLRHDQHILLNPTDFYRLSDSIQHFIVHCEQVCGRTCYGLRGTWTSQQKGFIDHFHMERVKQEAQLIENEQWTASEVPSDFQSIVDRICDGHIYDEQPINKNEEEKEQNKSTKHLVMHDTHYYVVGCSLLIIKMFEDYLKCVVHLESMANEITQKLVELLKPLTEFDRIVEDYRNHQGEIHAKLVAIMNERFAAHIKAMQALDFDQEPQETGKNANIYMETLVTETVRLHKVLSKYLPVYDLKFILSQVFESFTTQLSHQINTMTIKTEKGKTRLERDVLFFTRRLKSLSHVDPPSNAVIEAVDAIITEEE